MKKNLVIIALLVLASVLGYSETNLFGRKFLTENAVYKNAVGQSVAYIVYNYTKGENHDDILMYTHGYEGKNEYLLFDYSPLNSTVNNSIKYYFNSDRICYKVEISFTSNDDRDEYFDTVFFPDAKKDGTTYTTQLYRITGDNNLHTLVIVSK